MIVNGTVNTVAVVKSEVDIKSFQIDPGWFELTKEEYDAMQDKGQETTQEVTKRTTKKSKEQ